MLLSPGKSIHVLSEVSLLEQTREAKISLGGKKSEYQQLLSLVVGKKRRIRTSRIMFVWIRYEDQEL